MGRTDTDVNADYTVSGISERDDGVTIGVVAGYKIDSAILGANFNITNSDDLLGAGDHYRVYDRAIVAGYSFDLAKRLRIIPIIGLNYWKLSTSEGRLFNPGPEERQSFELIPVMHRVGKV